MASIDSDVAKLGVQKQSTLQLGQPDLISEFAILVKLNPADASVVFLAIPVLHIELPQIMEAGCRAYNAGLRRLC